MDKLYYISDKGGVLARFAERAKELSEEKQIQIIENIKTAVCIQNKEIKPNMARSLLIDNTG